MLKSYFKIAFRNLWKNKIFSIINIFGLSLGMACCFLTVLYCWHEFSYDDFHPDKDRLYRIEYSMDRGTVTRMGRIPPTIAPALLDYFPQIESTSRFYPRALSVELPKDQRQFEIDDVFFVDSTVVDVFHFDFLHGDAQSALHRPESVIISDEIAQRLFGRTDVLGEALTLAGEDGFSISGVVKNWPDNSHLAFNMLLPFESITKVEPAHARENIKGFIANNWTATYAYTYVKLKPNQDPAEVDERFKNFIQEKGREPIKNVQAFYLTPVTDLHLYTEAGGPKPSGNLSYLYLFLIVGLLTLLIACINFINLSTAGSMKRAKEVGVRKVLGAQRGALVSQFLGESILVSFLSFILSMILTAFTLPALNNFSGVNIPMTTLLRPSILALFLIIFLLTGLLAGLYPAFFVTRFKPVAVLKGTLSNSRKPWNEWLRKGLITVQFLAAIAFITGAMTIFLQNRFLSNQPLGFNQELILSLPLNSANNLNTVLRPGDATLRKRMNTFDESLLSHPNINAVTQCSRLPGLGAVGRRIATDSVADADNFFPRVLSVDYDFVETFDLEILAGRDFDASFGTDHTSSFMINEQTMNRLGWDDPEVALGKDINLEGKKGKVVGVLKDFHFENLRSEIQPFIMEVRPGAFSYFALSIGNSNIPKTLRFIEDKWTAAFPEKGFEYTFLDDDLNDTYQVEQRLSTIIAYFAFLTIFICCFGLFGLAAMVTQQRFKEIGIRKVLGASAIQILQLISRDFIRLIAVAMLIAIPISWYFLKDWLAEFAYRIDFPWWAAVASGVVVMLIAFVTISAQSIRAALSNPVEAIKNE